MTENKKKNSCINLECNKQACYNFINLKKVLYCFEHKEPDMINVKDKKCEHEGCLTKPIFDLPNGKPQFCSKHKLDVKTFIGMSFIYYKTNTL